MFDHQTSDKKSTNVRVRAIQAVNRLGSQIAPKTTARFAELLFVTSTRTKRPLRESAWETDASRAVIPCAAGPIPIWIWGDGPDTVLLVHGWSGRGLQLGAFIEPLVDRGFRVVTHDAPGHGNSKGHTSSMIKFAAAIGAVSRHFGNIAGVIAHSLGGTASIYALAQKELIAQSLVVIAPSADLRAMCDRYGEMTGFSSEVVDLMRKRFEKSLGFDWEGSEPLSIAKRAATPMLVVHDRDDRFIPFFESRQLAATWPHARLMTTSGLGHHRILRDTKVIKATADFVAITSKELRLHASASNQSHRERKAS